MRTQVCKDDNFTVKKRKLFSKKSVQSTTAVNERKASSNKMIKRKCVD